MSNNIDLIQILVIVILGMFIPFLGSIVIVFGMDLTIFDNLLKIVSTFMYFLLIFGIELLIVYFYFTISNKIAGEKLKKFKPK